MLGKTRPFNCQLILADGHVHDPVPSLIVGPGRTRVIRRNVTNRHGGVGDDRPFSSLTVPDIEPVVCAKTGSDSKRQHAISNTIDLVALIIGPLLLKKTRYGWLSG